MALGNGEWRGKQANNARWKSFEAMAMMMIGGADAEAELELFLRERWIARETGGWGLGNEKDGT